MPFLDEIGLATLWECAKEKLGAKTSAVTLYAVLWTEGADAYEQTVTVAGGTENSRVALEPTAAQLTALQDDGVTFLKVDNSGGEFTAKAGGAMPTTDMTIQATLMEVI